MDKQEKKNYRLYRKQRRWTRRTLIQAAKEYRPWDERYLFDFMEIIFKDWEQYYRLGFNATLAEGKEPTREEIAAQLSLLLDDMKYVQSKDCDEKSQKFADYFARYIH